MSLLTVDVGAGTQDILLYLEDVPLEGSTKMVLPSQTVIVGSRINRARMSGRDVFLCGPTMGGGASTAAIRRHLAAGLKVFATSSAAATINDDLERVAEIGVVITDDIPDSAEVIKTGDIDVSALRQIFRLAEIEFPDNIAIAVQDHGYSPKKSNRLVRFEHLTKSIRAGGGLESFAYREPPESMTRMRAVRDTLVSQGLHTILMDTGPAAIFGASFDSRCIEPAIVINFGNGHTVAAILDHRRITGIFEHHTSQMEPKKLRTYIDRLCDGTLKNSDVFADGGHGAYIDEVPNQIRSIMVTRPRREPFMECEALKGAIAASPGGDMMITGCIGLLEAWGRREYLWR